MQNNYNQKNTYHFRAVTSIKKYGNKLLHSAEELVSPLHEYCSSYSNDASFSPVHLHLVERIQAARSTAYSVGACLRSSPATFHNLNSFISSEHPLRKTETPEDFVRRCLHSSRTLLVSALPSAFPTDGTLSAVRAV